VGVSSPQRLTEDARLTEHARLTEDAWLEARTRRFDAIANRVAPYFGLVLGTVVTPVVFPTGARFWLVTAPLVAASAAWSWWFTRPRRGPGSAPATLGPAGSGSASTSSGPSPAGLASSGPSPAGPIPGLVTPHDDGTRAARHGWLYLTGLLALTAALVVCSPFYGFQAFVGYLHSVAYLRRYWTAVGVVATALLASYAQLGGAWNPLTTAELGGLAALTVVNTLVGGGFTYFGYFTNYQSEQRRQIIAELNETNRRLAESLAENAALHARLMEQAREAGVLDERARLAREIHDTIAQGLAGVVAQLEAARGAEGDPGLHQRHLDRARVLARESLAEARRSVQALAPSRLVGARLPDAIAEMAQAWGETAAVTVHLETAGDARALLPDLEVTLFRVAQEALANVGKHAGATNVWLTLTYMEDVVVLDVRDDGTGFDPSTRLGPAGEAGYGLSTMEQRVRRVAGTFTIESAPGEGTAVSASVPAIPAESGPVADPARPDRTEVGRTAVGRTDAGRTDWGTA
jgi:signal transduction histidine kinase